MADNLFLPTLSEEGWVQSTAEQADYLLSHFFASEYSQTHIYQGHVASFQWLLQDGQGDMTKTINNIRTTLSLYFAKYFNEVDTEVTYKEETSGSSKITVNIFMSFTDRTGKQYSLGKALDVVDSKISKIIDINNG